MPRKPPIKMSGNGKIPVKTKPQTSGRSGIGIWDGLISGTQCIGSDSRRDLYRVYREMRNHPTIALARAAAYAPMRNAAWRIDADEDVPEEMQLAIQADLLRLRDDLLANMLRAMDYGWQSFERIPTFTADHWAIARLKPLLPELTEIVTDKQTGEFTGLRQRDVILAPEECFIFTYDPEADDLYGRSRNENLRQIWKASTTLLEQQVGYNRRVAGVIPIIRIHVVKVLTEAAERSTTLTWAWPLKVGWAAIAASWCRMNSPRGPKVCCAQAFPRTSSGLGTSSS